MVLFLFKFDKRFAEFGTLPYKIWNICNKNIKSVQNHTDQIRIIGQGNTTNWNYYHILSLIYIFYHFIIYVYHMVIIVPGQQIAIDKENVCSYN